MIWYIAAFGIGFSGGCVLAVAIHRATNKYLAELKLEIEHWKYRAGRLEERLRTVVGTAGKESDPK